ncbi:agamous-like MADS-box protein AGL80 [Bidens hawaiensis]|uniref:agamous-like MADS-box protein AGL80 n=1 Tax=Bidens hawaiensis TaxID=980011 RepID=UPI004048FCC3
MPRTKVKLAFIENIKSRKSSFTKRKESLKKKLHELCTLCDVKACLILYIPNECEPELWPNDKDAVLHVVRQFRAKPEIERRKNMLNLESYLVEKINKAKEQLNKHVMANRELVKDKMLSDCLSGKVSVADLNPTELKELVSFAGLKILEINERMELLTSDAHAAAATPQSQHPQPPTVVGDSSTSNNKTTEGTDVEPYVPVMENTRPSDVPENIDWYPSDWVSDHEDNGLALVPRFDMKKSFTKDLWSDTFFLKKD